jgi:Flp pilus assembly protein TadG
MRTWYSRTRTILTRDSLDEAAARGQVILMFALFLTVMIGVLGLAVDVGFAVSQRRSMQNAADAGALAGTHVVVKSPTGSAQAAVVDVVNKNAMNGGTIGTITCVYVNDAGTELSSCNATVHPSATGVRVTVQETHPTFFIRVVPGVGDTVNTSAVAKANVKKLGMPTDGPYIPCGIDSKLASGGTMDLVVKVGGVWKINSAAIGKDFLIHAPQPEDCETKSSRWKGLADTDYNRGKTAPNWFHYKEGDAAGTISVDVAGPDGCKAGQEVVNCVVFLPIGVPDPPEPGNNKEIYVVAFAPFYITAPKSNEHWGRLLTDYIVFTKGDTGDYGWSQDYEGPITIRLTE